VGDALDAPAEVGDGGLDEPLAEDIAGLGAGVAFGRLVGALLFQVTPTDPAALASPLAILGTVFALASVPPAIRAIRTDPTETLKRE
jgi:hypothetical protein